jgi:hypothetical protein
MLPVTIARQEQRNLALIAQPLETTTWSWLAKRFDQASNVVPARISEDAPEGIWGASWNDAQVLRPDLQYQLATGQGLYVRQVMNGKLSPGTVRKLNDEASEDHHRARIEIVEPDQGTIRRSVR